MRYLVGIGINSYILPKKNVTHEIILYTLGN